MNTHLIEPPPIIAPLVMRHAEDAAFYWSQLDSAHDSMRIGLGKYADFNRLLDAHLEGLAVAGADGLQPALAALQRWKGAAEAFACIWLAVQLHDAEAMAAVLEQVRRQPDALLRGAISALAWFPGTTAHAWITRLGIPDAHAADQVAALRAAALCGPDAVKALSAPLATYLTSPHAPVRAAACRAAARSGDIALSPALRTALRDEDMAVRAEAAIALGYCDEWGWERAAPVLLQCVVDQAAWHAQATGWYRKLAARRLARWVRHLAALTPIGNMEVLQLLAALPPRAKLTFVLHHGDGAYLPDVIERMADPAITRYAGWVWQTLTGLDLVANGLTMPEPEATDDELAEPITEARLDADQGLPLPNIDAVRACHATHALTLPRGVRCLLGRELTSAFALDVLDTAPQAIRSIAAQKLMQAFPGAVVTVRGPASAQRRQIAALRERMAA